MYTTLNNLNSRREIMFESSVGLLEGVFSIGKENPVKKIALILPPDPIYKATMHNKVINAMFKTFEDNNFAVLKINYRGVGKSKGQALTKEEKLVDSLEALDWLIKKCKSTQITDPLICISGFALGGWLALQSAMRRPEVTNFITVNAAFSTSEFNMLTPCPSGLILQANKDILSPLDGSIHFHSQLIVQKGSNIQHKILEDDHSFKSNFEAFNENLNLYIKSIATKSTYPSN